MWDEPRDRAYEDSLSWAYGAEIASRIADDCIARVDAPVRRVASTDTFVGYAPRLEDAILPQVEDFSRACEEIVRLLTVRTHQPSKHRGRGRHSDRSFAPVVRRSVK